MKLITSIALPSLLVATASAGSADQICFQWTCNNGRTRWSGWFWGLTCECEAGWEGACCDQQAPLEATVWQAEAFKDYGTDGIVDYGWPEQQLPGWGDNTANVGLSISGGGSRSYAAGFGSLRALYDLGTNSSSNNVGLDRARYLQGTSGAAWLAAAYTYHQTGVDDRELLGLMPDLSTLTPAKLEEMSETSLAYGATKDMFFPLLSDVFRSKAEVLSGVDPGEVWSNAVTSAVLAPYGLDDHDKYFTLNEESKQAILSANPAIDADDIILPAPGARPYMILPITTIGPNKEDSLQGNAPLLDGTKKAYTNIEATPLYTGYPLARELTVSYADGSEVQKKSGGIIESFAYGSAAPSEPLNFQGGRVAESTTVKVPLAENKWSIAQAAGASSTWGDKDLYFLEQPTEEGIRKCHDEVVWHDVSTWGNAISNFFSGEYCSVITGDATVDLLTDLLDFPLVGPKATEWSTHSNGVPTNNNIRLADGDVEGDPLGLFNVLVRNVDHLISFGNGATALCDEGTWDPEQDVSVDTLDACISDNLPPLFGIPVKRSANEWGSPDRSVERLQVFKTEDFAPFVKQMQKNMADGKTAVARVQLTTVENLESGVPAGHVLDWCHFSLSSSPKFIASLPKETRAELEKGLDGKFARFPHYNTLLQNPILGFNDLGDYLRSGFEGELVEAGLTSLTNEQTNLLAALGSWAVKENVELYRDMFD